MGDHQDQKVAEFAEELGGFAKTAENALTLIEADPHGNKGEFSQFSEMMFAIRGTAQQLGYASIAEMAGFGEEIAVKGPGVEKGSQIKKCIAALWDTLTTVKYMLENNTSALEATEEQDILRNRLQAVLRSLGGARETVTADDIEKMLRGES